jgi:hypothetical protein
MFQGKNRKFFFIVGLTIILMLLVTTIAIADDFLVDGDIVTDGIQFSVDLGTVAPGAILSPKVSFQLICSSKQHVDNGQTVTLTYDLQHSTIPAEGSVSVTAATIGAIPNDWPDDTSGGGSTNCPTPNVTLDDNGDSIVTITAPTTPGVYTYALQYASTLSPEGNNDGTAIHGGDFARVEFSLTVSSPADTTAPTLHLPGDITIEATSSSGVVVDFAPTADDTDPAHPTVTCTPASGSTFELGTTTVNCSAADTAGNTAYGSFTVTVQDTTPPVLSLPADITEEATGPSGAAVTFTVTANDLVDGSVAVTCVPASGSTFAITTTAVSCSATDAHGNTGTGSFNVTVQDTTPPTIDFHADVGPIDATGLDGAIVIYTSPATHDLVDGDGVATCLPASGSTFALGDTTVTCNATDFHGNAATPTYFKVMVRVQLYGFFQPVDMDGVINVVKGGSTVPLKFKIFAGTTEITDIDYIKTFTYNSDYCSGGTVEDDIETLATGGTVLRYTNGQFIFNWKTPKTTGCFRVTLTTMDGSTLVADFRLK